ncbi:Copper amine oxidase 1 like protein [Verticillium longisporum]|nr:Copper amine oxidase 1 like protein [Verticillium longisporum]
MRIITNTDIVLWHTFGITHFPAPEDYPVMPAEPITLLLRPRNFFEKNPCMDIPPSYAITPSQVQQGKDGCHCAPSKESVNVVSGQVLPGAATLPNDATDAQWETWARNNAVPNAHPIGTASMMSRELGGVVDPELKVYGTANVRVVDASVMPIQTSGHLTSTIYALAERLSDIIKDTA